VSRLSLKTRMAAAATAAVALVLLAAGVATVATFASRERSSFDRALEERAKGPAGHVELRAPGPGAIDIAPPPPGEGVALDQGPPGGLLAESGSFVRVLAGGHVLRAAGDVPAEGLPATPRPGFDTVEAAGRKWRTLTVEPPSQPAGFGDGAVALIQFGADAGPLEDRIDSMQRRVALISTLGVGITILLATLLAGPALAPLSRLRRAVAGVTSTRDLSHRLPEGEAGREVDELAHGVNEMLGRLEASSAETERALESTRRFAGDVGHEVRTPLTSMRANVDAVRRNPSMPESQRSAILDDVAREQDDLVAVLDALQALARGDAATALPREPVDMAGVVDVSVEAARRRHPSGRVELTAAEGEHLITGWPDGLRLLVDNLLENALRHGGSRVAVTLERDARGDLLLTVDDDGPGIPVRDRVKVFERFARGADSTSPGSGLGLALVAQQAQLHGGDVRIGDSPQGGASLRVLLPAGNA
jgi:two-component system, OmpR family, sensor histidine kinase PrrB